MAASGDRGARAAAGLAPGVAPGQGDPAAFSRLRLHARLHASILELVNIDVDKADALIIGLGQYGRRGDLMRRLEASRARMRS